MSPSGAASGRFWWVIIAAVLLVSSFVLMACSAIAGASPEATKTPIPPDKGNIHVTVTGVDGTPLVKGVIIRVTDSIESDGDDNGEFRLESCPAGHYIAAWAPNYRVGFIPCDGSSNQYSISLLSLQGVGDNPNYAWASAYGTCSPCHAAQLSPTYSEISEWESSGHGRVFRDPYFQTMYRGTDISGVSGPVTERVFMGNQLVRKPKTDAPEYKGPGFQLDYPGQAGNCGFCHAPAAVVASRAEVDLSPLFFANGDLQTEGITCDVCHKVNGVILNDNGYPFVDKPGILSLQLLRSDLFRTEPFSNIISPVSETVQPVSMCSPIYSSSEFCAACHYGKFGDMLIYASYKEWKESSYADDPKGKGYRTCQDCHMSHMQVEDATPFSRRKACSETAKGFQDFSHNLMDFGRDEKLGRDIPRMVRGAAQIGASFEYKPEKDDSFKVNVVVSNKTVGHKFPTDSPLRHLILVLEGKDQFGNTLLQVNGSQIPNWGGLNSLYMENSGVKGYAGLPGKIFANLLIEEDINLWPSAAYWNQTKPAQVTKKDGVISDNRLEPGGKDESQYYFAAPDDGEVEFTISLIYRFGFYDLMQQKRWVDTAQRQDIPVVVIHCSGNVNQARQIECKQIDP